MGGRRASATNEMGRRDQMKKKQMKKKRMTDPDAPLTPGAMLFGLFALILFVIATGVVVGLALQEQQVNLPNQVDLVCYEIPESQSCIEAQVVALSQNLKFRRNIYILTTNPERELGICDFVWGCYWVPCTAPGPTQKELNDQMFANVTQLVSLTDIPAIADRFMFFGNTTMPYRNVSENALFYSNRPRAFNIFRDAAEVATLQPYFTFTSPCCVGRTSFVDSSPSDAITNFMLFSMSQDQIVVRNDFLRDIFVNRNSQPLIDNYESQFNKLDSNPPLFATFHVTGNDIADAYTALGAYLTNHFV